MNVLVTGGSGFLGEKVVNGLKRRRQKITVFDKQKPDIDKIKFIRGDICSTNTLSRAFNNIDIVYHLAASLDEHDSNLREINVEGTKNVVKLCENNGVSQLIYPSSSGVLGETIISAKESFPYDPKTRYEKTKAEAEKVIISSSIPYTIVRASILVGPNKIWKDLFDAVEQGFPIIGDGKNYLHLTGFDDFVKVLMDVRDNNKAKNEIFHVATKDLPTYEEVYDLLSIITKTKSRKKRVSKIWAYCYSYLNLLISKLKRREQELIYRKATLDRLLRDRKLNIGKAERVLDFEPSATWSVIEKTYKKLNK